MALLSKGRDEILDVRLHHFVTSSRVKNMVRPLKQLNLDLFGFEITGQRAAFFTHLDVLASVV